MKLTPDDAEPFMPPPTYGHSLSGLTFNLLTADLDRAVTFHVQVLQVEFRHLDTDLGIAVGFGTEWMVHADHTYDRHPLHRLARDAATRGAGVELRLHHLDPDTAVRAARQHGFTVFDGPRDQPDHGLREAHIQDHDGYIWVPDIPISPPATVA